ncbi:hypothetical protein JEQ12_010265 [Ovis aries]|uniref:Uncharacterized protein n=1 Tax=Ovis aries TaxID=9940 RepID=A0A836CVA5_SHEEP|nr:hypothetical protein JEQ12_010265 [Ovis aries]
MEIRGGRRRRAGKVIRAAKARGPELWSAIVDADFSTLGHWEGLCPTHRPAVTDREDRSPLDPCLLHSPAGPPGVRLRPVDPSHRWDTQSL